ncbi:MAG: hypothetical protein AB7G23_11020 [Vicinamibacterales bacterium]
MIRQLSEAWSVFRPRTVAQTRKNVDDLRVQHRDVHRSLKLLQEQIEDFQEKTGQRFDALAAELRRMHDDNQKLRLRESQLRAIVERDIQLEHRSALLESVLNHQGAKAYIERKMEDAELRLEPFPHIVIDDFLPRSFYDAIILGLPPLELFMDHPPNKRRVDVPFTFAPMFGRKVWRHLSRSIVPEVFVPALIAKFRGPLDAWLKLNFPNVGDDPVSDVEWAPWDGRIMLRTRGYYIPPHRDPKWGFMTCLLYLAREGDDPAWGTQIMTVDDDVESKIIAPDWFDEKRCHVVDDVKFVPNRLFVFLNSVGAHSARIPQDAPEDAERYLYQFRVGPNGATMAKLMRLLPEERRQYWAGKIADY